MNEIKNILVNGDKAGAGLPYLYRTEGLPAEVYEVRMNQNIQESLLNQAITDSIKRYPYFSVKFEERDGDFFAVANAMPLEAHHMKGAISLGGHSNNYHLMGIAFWEKTLTLSFHHGLTDGRGAKNFLEKIVNNYNDYLTAAEDDYEKIKRIHETEAMELSVNEMSDPCMEKNKIKRNISKIQGLESKGYKLPEASKKGAHRRYELKFSQDEFMEKCRAIGASPIVYISTLMSRAIKNVHPESNKPIICNFPMDARAILGYDETFKNCVKSMTLPYGKLESTLSDEEISARYKSLLGKQRDKDYCAKEFNTIHLLLDVISHFHSFASRNKLLGFMENLELDTYLISYVGRFDMPQNLVEEVHLYSNCSSGLVLNMTCQSGYFIIDLVQDFETEEYANSIANMFSDAGISLSVSQEIMFETPTDELREIITSPANMKELRDCICDKIIAAARESTAAAKAREQYSLSLSYKVRV